MWPPAGALDPRQPGWCTSREASDAEGVNVTRLGTEDDLVGGEGLQAFPLSRWTGSRSASVEARLVRAAEPAHPVGSETLSVSAARRPRRLSPSWRKTEARKRANMSAWMDVVTITLPRSFLDRIRQRRRENTLHLQRRSEPRCRSVSRAGVSWASVVVIERRFRRSCRDSSSSSLAISGLHPRPAPLTRPPWLSADGRKVCSERGTRRVPVRLSQALP